MNNANLTRRNFLKGSAAAAGAAAVAVTGFSQLFGYEQVFAQGKGDDIQTIVNLASTAEQLAVTHYYTVLTDSRIQLTPSETTFLRGALDTEYQHLQFLLANGAKPLASEFYFPTNVYTDRDQFSTITEQAESAFVAAYLAAVRRISELGNPLLAATAAQVAVTEQVHLALIRQIGGRVPNHVSLGQALFYNTSEAGAVLKGFLEGGSGFVKTARKLPGVTEINGVIGKDTVTSIKPFTDATLFPDQAGSSATMAATMAATSSK